MSEYNHKEIEPKWRKHWKDNQTYRVTEDTSKEKFYVLDMFPYPSGAGLHVGHPLGYIASDIYARYKKAQGFNVLHPMGYDSFGLPAEQYAIQTGQHPAVTTEQNIARYREQLDQIGFAFDWSREVRTSDPKYYKWTQWIFKEIFNSWYNKKTDKAESILDLVQLFETEGNANVDAVCEATATFSASDWNSWEVKKQQEILMNYRLAFLADSWVNWCPALGTVLANDEVKDGVSERGGHPVEQKLMRQWSMRITAYADRLLTGLDRIDFSDSLKEQQRNWIGKSQGASVRFEVDMSHLTSTITNQPSIEVFTTRPDTIFGVTFMVLAPEHPLVDQITTPEYADAIAAYKRKASLKTERDRQANVKDITGQFTGAYAIHPFTGAKVQIWIGEYVLASYGTGAVMAVPCGDQRDYDFAKHFGIEIPNIFEGVDISKEAYTEKDAVIANSDFLNGLPAKEAIAKAVAAIEAKGIGNGKINYRLRDAIFSRQRYWGEPFPVYYKDEVPYLIDDAQLPVTLPEVDKYLPTEDGEPPLARAKNWDVNITSPQPSPEERESDEDDENSFEGFYKTSDTETWFKLKELARENRKSQTKCESIIWQEVRNNKLGCRIRRQQVIDNYIVDFVAFSSKLVIEIDGESHDGARQKEYDESRTGKLKELGFEVIRIQNEDVLEDLDGTIAKIKQALRSNSLPDSHRDEGGVDFRMEYNTMPGWAGSSWYFLRYMDPHNENEFASTDKLAYWNQVDLYIGGAEHATGHLLYSRFWTKFLYDRGYITFDEPFKKLINQGMILGRSSLAYRLQFATNEPNNPNGMSYTENLPSILLSSKFAYAVLEGHNPYSKDENAKLLRGELNLKIQKYLESKLDFKYYGHVLVNIGRIYVDISLVENDILDIEAFKNWRPEYKDAEFILEDSKYICGHEIEKMSKSKYNVQTPDELVEKFGADTLRCYEMFLGPLEQFKPWDVQGINGVSGFLRKFWRLFHQGEAFNVSEGEAPKAALKTLHKTIKKITEDLDRYSFNTVVSGLMIAVNELIEQKCNNRTVLEGMVTLLAPYAPHISEELWEKLGHATSVTTAAWPVFDPAMLVEDAFEYPVSFNGKMRFKLELPTNLTPQQVEAEVMACEKTAQYLEGKMPKKVIVVPKKIVNVVV